MNRDEPQNTDHDADGVRLVNRDEADQALRSGQAVGRRDVTGSEGPSRTAPHTQGIIRFPSENELGFATEHRPTLVTRREEIESLPTQAEKIIDIRDSVNDEADAEKPKVTAAGFPSVEMPHWTERPSAAAGTGGRSGNNFSADGDDRNLFSWDTLGESEEDSKTMADDDEKAADLEDSGVTETSDEETPETDKVVVGNNPAEKPGKGLNRASLITRVGTGLAASAVALMAFAAGPAATLALALVVVLAAAIEYFDAVRRVGYRPATLLGLIAVAGLVLGAYARGAEALPLVTTLALVFTFLWFLTGVSKAKPSVNIAVTLLGVVWVGLLGSFAALLLRMPDREGLAFLIGAIAVTVAYDTGAYVGGSLIGRRPLVPAVSPNKTWEGLAAGTVAALLVGGLLVSVITPWGVVSGLLLGLIVAVVAPLGDLAESMVKRDLGIKDMGNLLPGHGGVLDRFDAMLFVLPATYYLVLLLDIA